MPKPHPANVSFLSVYIGPQIAPCLWLNCIPLDLLLVSGFPVVASASKSVIFFFFMERCLFSVLGILCLPQFFSARQSQVKTNVTPKATQLNPNKTTKFLTSSSVLIIYQSTSLSMLQNDDIYRNHTNNLEN